MRSNYTDALNLILRMQNLVTNISILAGYAVKKRLIKRNEEVKARKRASLACRPRSVVIHIIC